MSAKKNESALDIDVDDISGQEAAELAEHEGLQEMPAPVAEPPVPGKSAPSEESSIDDLMSSMDFDQKYQMLMRLQNQRGMLDETIERLEQETNEMDGVGFLDHGIALCEELNTILRPLRLGGELGDELAPFRKIEELKQWLMQGMTSLKSEAETEPSEEATK